MQAFRSSVLRFLTIDPRVLNRNKPTDIYSTSARIAISTFSTDPRRRQFPAANAPSGGEEEKERPPLDEITQRKHFAETVEKAKGAALRLLSQRSHSRKELITKLEEREHPHDAISSALDRLSEVGLQSDAEFADVFARSKWRQVKWAPRKIKQELTRRGIAPELVQEAIESVFGPDGLSMRRYMEEELAEEQLGPWTPAGAPESALLVAARRQFQLTAGLSDEARKRRIVGWLQRRGHSWEVVSRVLKWLDELTMQMKDKLGKPEKPLQMSAAGKGVRSAWYRATMVGAAAMIAGWWYWTTQEEKKLQSAAVERFGKHGEKAEYGKSFQDTVNDPNHFPGSIPTKTGSASTNIGKPRGDV